MNDNLETTEKEREERKKFFKDHNIPCNCDGRLCSNCYRYYTATNKMVMIEKKDGVNRLIDIPAFLLKTVPS